MANKESNRSIEKSMKMYSSLIEFKKSKHYKQSREMLKLI